MTDSHFSHEYIHTKKNNWNEFLYKIVSDLIHCMENHI